MLSNWKESVYLQREQLARLLHEPLARLADACVPVWGDREGLDRLLMEGFDSVPYCTFLYVLDTNGIQISDNVSREGLLPEHYGRDRSERPYMKEAVPAWGFLLSDAYISLRARRPSLTALHVVRNGERTLGYLGADFDLRNLPVTSELYEEPWAWRQIKGDPSIRGTVFLQTRQESILDRNMEQAMSILAELLTERGIFQGMIHFSSSQATVWVVDDPYRYRILDAEALTDPDICLAYPRRDYPQDALIPASAIVPILNSMCALRTGDDTIYLRSSSINIFNGMVSLTFSCDGSHYLRYDEFLDKNLAFWFGSAA